jgi:SAM-dependent methyltransferase
MTHHHDHSAYAAMNYMTRVDDAAQLTRRALSLLDRANPRMLDLGCGGGGIAIAAARARPDLTAVALDISPANVAAAQEAADQFGVGGRVVTVCSDYLAWRGEPFDLIISDNVLHFVEGADAAIASRLSSDLRPGGILVATLPIESTGNSLRILFRRMWGTLPPAADRLALALGRRIYRKFTPDALAERLPYLRRLPARLAGARLRDVFATYGLELISEFPWESTCAVKLEHHLFIWRRR